MKTRLLSFFLLLTAIPALSAGNREPQRGYRGFTDLEWSSYTYDFAGRRVSAGIGVTTAHGYQFNPHFFAGAGFSLVGNNILPVYVDARTDWKFGFFTPFADLKLGYNLLDGGGIYFSPTVGHRFNWGRKLGINLGFGLTIKGFKADLYNIITDGNGYTTFVKVGDQRFSRTYFTARIGIDF